MAERTPTKIWMTIDEAGEPIKELARELGRLPMTPQVIKLKQHQARTSGIRTRARTSMKMMTAVTRSTEKLISERVATENDEAILEAE